MRSPGVILAGVLAAACGCVGEQFSAGQDRLDLAVALSNELAEDIEVVEIAFFHGGVPCAETDSATPSRTELADPASGSTFAVEPGMLTVRAVGLDASDAPIARGCGTTEVQPGSLASLTIQLSEI